MDGKYVVYSGSKEIYHAMIPALKSLLKNSSVDHVWLLTEGKFNYEVPDNVTVMDCSDLKDEYFNPYGPNMKTHFTWFAMLRAALCFILPVDQVLSLDIDTICVKNIDEIWDYELKDNYFSAVREPHRCRDGLIYTNIGVAMYNLKKLRKGKAQEVLEVLNRQYFTFVDQDVFNYLCQGYIAPMPSRFNVTRFTERCSTPSIIHYAGQSHWFSEPEYQAYSGMSWDEL